MNKTRHGRSAHIGSVMVAASTLLGACSHMVNRRGPASDSPDLKKYSVNFTLIRDAEVDRLVRVYHGIGNTKVTRLEISNPGGQVVCQNGAPPNPELPPKQSDPYVLDANPDQDTFCYLGPASPTVASIQVDYRYTVGPAVPDTPAPTTDVMQRALHDVQTDQLTPETLGVLQAHNLVGGFTLFARADGDPYKIPKKGSTVVEPHYSRNLAAGDLLMIQSVSGALGASRAELETAPYDASGLRAPATHAKLAAPAVDTPVAHDTSYLFPDERPHRLICTIQDGDEAPQIIYRGGDDLLATREAQGTFRCQLNLKKTANAEHLHGFFTISASVIKRSEALSALQSLTQSEDQGKSVRDQQTEDTTLALLRTNVATLVADDAAIVARYNHLIVARSQAPAPAAPKSDVPHRVDDFFPNWINLSYRPGPYTFSIVPVKRSMPGPRGTSVDYADFTIQDSSTPYYAENPVNPTVVGHENRFAPVTAISSSERWGSINREPWQVIICPKNMAAATAALNTLAADNLRGVTSTRNTVWQTLMRFGARNALDCDLSWVDSSVRGSHSAYEPIYFQRQGLFRFSYVKESLEVADGGSRKIKAVYNPDRIEVLYSSPTGATITKVMDRTDNNGRGPGNGHPFFSQGRATGVLFSASSQLPAHIHGDFHDLYPPVDADGMIEDFPFPTQ